MDCLFVCHIGKGLGKHFLFLFWRGGVGLHGYTLGKGYGD